MSDTLKWYLSGILVGLIMAFTMSALILPDAYYHKGIEAHYKGEYECATVLERIVCREVEK